MDIIESMRPFIKISQVCGLFPYVTEKRNKFYSLRVSKPLVKYSKLLLWIIALAEGGSVINISFSFYSTFTAEISSKVVIFLTSVTLYLSYIMIFHRVIKKKKLLCRWVNKLNILCSTTNLKINCECLKKLNARMLILSSLFFFIIVITDIWVTEIDYQRLFVEMIFYIRLWEIQLFLKHFVMYTNFIRFLYKEMQDHLKMTKEKEEVKEDWVKCLRELREKDLFIKDFVEVVQLIFMPVLGIELAWAFVAMLFDITLTGRAKIPTAMQIEWMIYICKETVLYIGVCHLAMKEGEKTASCLQDLFIDIDDPELLYELEIFSLQLQHCKLDFNVLGFFRVDFGLLYSMIGATTTYSVILLQFQNDVYGNTIFFGPENVTIETNYTDVVL